MGAAWALAAPPGAGASRVVLPGLAAVSAYGVVFLIAAWVVRSEELRGLVEAVARRRSSGASAS